MGGSTFSIGRRYERRVESIPLNVVGEFEGTWNARSGVTIDFSRGGCRIRTAAPVARGQIIEIIPKMGQGYAKRSQVIWVRKVRSGEEREAGLEFLQPLRRDTFE